MFLFNCPNILAKDGGLSLEGNFKTEFPFED